MQSLNFITGLFVLGVLLVPFVSASVTLSVSQDIQPGDNWRQSVNLQNVRRNAYLDGTLVSNNGWCLWDNGRTVKEIRLEPLETRVEVLMIDIPSDIVLDSNVCVITFEGTHTYTFQGYIYLGLGVLVSVIIFLVIRHSKSKPPPAEDLWGDIL